MSRRILFRRAGLLILGTAAAAFVACSVSQKAAKDEDSDASTTGPESTTVPELPRDGRPEPAISRVEPIPDGPAVVMDTSVQTQPPAPAGTTRQVMRDNFSSQGVAALNLVNSAFLAGDEKNESAYLERFTQGVPSLDPLRAPSEPVNRENYAHFDDNPVRLVSEHPVSTFSVDVDTGSYANVRRMLTGGQLPPFDAVRVEELINYFSYDYAVPDDTDIPFSINTEIATTPWNPATLLLRIGLKGFEVREEERPAANLVFLIDVSGSMKSADKLPLLKSSFRLLTNILDERDSVAIVVYAGATGMILEPTPGDEKARILSALDRLSAGGRTNGGAGIRLAYSLAQDAFVDGGINRVILATDGDFNVGTTDIEQLTNLVKERRKSGTALTTLGFGTGNYNDHLLEQLADDGNGNYAYIDSLNEGRKVLVEELSSTLMTIAKDVKIQIEFNPGLIAEYRLIGYENRILRREDFNNDTIDAGEIGAGHTVTALYELTLADSSARLIDPLRYSDVATADDDGNGNELAFVKLRYKTPDEENSRLIEQPVDRRDVRTLDEASEDLRFAAAVAAFGQALRGGDFINGFDLKDVQQLAEDARSHDPYGYRGEFITLVELGRGLSTPDRHAAR